MADSRISANLPAGGGQEIRQLADLRHVTEESLWRDFNVCGIRLVKARFAQGLDSAVCTSEKDFRMCITPYVLTQSINTWDP